MDRDTQRSFLIDHTASDMISHLFIDPTYLREGDYQDNDDGPSNQDYPHDPGDLIYNQISETISMTRKCHISSHVLWIHIPPIESSQEHIGHALDGLRRYDPIRFDCLKMECLCH